MIKFKKAGVWTDTLLYRIRKAGVWVDVETGKFKKVGVQTIYYERMLLRRPPEGTYSSMGAITFAPNGDVKVGPKYHDPINTLIGYWRASGVTPGPSDVFSIYVEKYLDQGDLEPGGSSLNTWHQMYPGSTTYKWSANNGGAGKCVLKITLKDQNNRQLIFYVELVYGGSGIVDYDPIDWDTGGGGGGGGGGGTDPSPPEEPTEPF